MPISGHGNSLTPRMKTLQALTLATLCMATATPALAGRPLATDDAATADAGACQVETWADHAAGRTGWVVAPACGLVPGLEAAAELVRPGDRSAVRWGSGLALKWVPEGARLGTVAGPVQLGLKLAAGWVKPAGAAWDHTESHALALASWTPAEAWAVHANLGTARVAGSGAQATLLNLALVWTPLDPALVFVETHANDRRALFGGTVTTVGGRWWLRKDKVGLDLTAGREAGAGGTAWTAGLGWYGIGL